MKKKAQTSFRDQWRQYNVVVDTFFIKKIAIFRARHKADIMEKVIQWLETDATKKMESVFKLDIPICEKSLEERSGQDEAWWEVLQELTNDGFNVTHSQGGTKHYHLVLKVVSDAEEKKIKERTKKMMKDLKVKLVKGK